MSSLGILISGRGSNMEAILGAVRDGRIGAGAAVVISSRPDAAGLGIAKRMGVRTSVIEPAGEERPEYDERIAGELADAGVTPEGGLVCLAGFMRILGPGIVSRYKDRILNVHPSLLPSFPGLSAQRQAIEAGVRVSGCTVHIVDAGTDTGPIIEQAAVPVLPGDTEESLAARILAEEHRIYPEAVAMMADGRVEVRDGRVIRQKSTPP
ncbi:MAG: phosphoribosylglycinamide formyltransferase [Nitrosopumilus sp.]|nr:phosphoribosylglycinamide formyltransferase [Nitrosopumilus sp.]MDA7957943.1 phosphoribosylglycinamide formyltransferase [Nitrosopumilus sp.]